VECADLRELERSLGRFNVFDVLKSAESELRHSNMLAWLLDPDESHGLHEFFLRRWLMLVLHEAADQERDLGLDPVEVDTEPFTRVEVLREWHHIDVLVKIRLMNEEWVIAIENKVKATQSQGQLERYRKDVERVFPHARKVFLFLTKSTEIPADERYISTRYETVQRVVSLCLEEGNDMLGTGPKYLLEQYNHLLTERFMANSKAVDLALKIYREHRDALDFIIEQIPDKLSEVGSGVSQLVEAAGFWTRSSKPVILLPPDWRVPQNIAANGWPLVCLEVRISEGKAVLAAQARQELKDPAWRQKLFLLAKQENWLSYNATKPGPIWFSFYSHPLTEIPFADGTPEEIAQEIFAKVKEALRTERFAGMVGKVAGLMGELNQEAVVIQ
jgi:hypothetical protein